MSENTNQSKNKIYLPKKYVESKLKKTVTEEFKPYQLSEEIFKHLNPTNDEPILPGVHFKSDFEYQNQFFVTKDGSLTL